MASSGKRALVVGATGIIGRSLATQLVREGWTTFGLSRSGSVELPGVTAIRADLLDPDALAAAVADARPSFAAITA
jgi:NAD(P)-dependent dehydrogenase (short-subunit alcohol dehydrogenase family)